MRILVTGGAGYIGSHMVDLLLRKGHEVVVIDDLRTGHREAVPARVPWLKADVADQREVTAFMREHSVRTVLHFASLIQVGESMSAPRKYYTGNLAAGISLLESALDAGVESFVLSSTAAVYGNPHSVPIDEEHPLDPINVYGETKLALEKMLASYARAYGLRFAALRYFNAAGADANAGLGERHEPESHLIPIVLEAALGSRPHVTVLGDDYPTPDGTCVRDYIHVCDLCEAHSAALAYLRAGGTSGAFNLGTGVGHSVNEVIRVAERVTRRAVRVVHGPRREGDPPVLVASPRRAEAAFGWRAHRSSLQRIVEDAWQWHARASDSPPDGTRVATAGTSPVDASSPTPVQKGTSQ
jgi:UDP-glucose 4-epimerase